jgi:hypothetical protein
MKRVAVEVRAPPIGDFMNILSLFLLPLPNFSYCTNILVASLSSALILSYYLENVHSLTQMENICMECNGFKRELDQVPVIICFTRRSFTNRRRAALQKGTFNHCVSEQY